MLLWLTVLTMGAVTYVVRVTPILLLGKLELPPLILRGLRYVPGAVLSAIVFPELVLREGSLALSLDNPRLLAGVLAALVAWRTRSMLLTLLVGMAALWGATALLG
ncbi:MAG: branched-chain amino acid ABC transporter permease [Chloroflexi bacterium RBG_13_66_10]|jgi:branched-subunit amino acid transport protein|nr:MAG: branched-chain amino acid ABC transporter permease [Chloroflexi bacterium RBG_13_66_10]